MTTVEAPSPVEAPSLDREAFPSTLRLDRRSRIVEARASLTEYLDAVVELLRAAGYTVRTRMDTGNELGAELRVGIDRVPTPGHGSTEGSTQLLATLRWAEDVGWSVTPAALRASPTPTRYLHLQLVPSPRAVVDFLRNALADPECGMFYPARFRFRSQSLQPVIESLTKAARAPSPSATGVPSPS